MIHRNFIQLNLAFAERHPYVISDTPSMPLESLLSNVGGTFSLWLGVTVMLLVEIVELIVTMVFAMICTGKKQKSVDPGGVTAWSK